MTEEAKVENIAASELRQFIERIERLEEEKQTIADDFQTSRFLPELKFAQSNQALHS